MTAPEPAVELRRDGRLAHVTLNRPGRRNSFDLAMLGDLEDILHALRRDRALEVVVLTGAGTAFCAGTDLRELAGLDAEVTMHVQRRTAELVEGWFRLDQTTLTVFNGPAIGSGAVLGLASDLRLAADTCFFQFPEVTFGIPLTWSGIAILSDLVGADRAKRWLLTGERLDATALERLHLVQSSLSGDALPAAVDALVDRLLSVPHAGRSMTKRAARLAGPRFESAATDSYLGALGVALRGQGEFLDGGTR